MSFYKNAFNALAISGLALTLVSCDKPSEPVADTRPSITFEEKVLKQADGQDYVVSVSKIDKAAFGTENDLTCVKIGSRGYSCDWVGAHQKPGHPAP